MKITMYELYEKIYYKNQPKHIKVYDEDWYWNDYDGYVTKESLNTTPDAQIYLMDRYRTFMNLDKEVEIIDDEEWRTIFDFPNYEVSNKGNIRSKEYNDSLGHLRSSKKLKKQVNNCGYEYVILSSKEEKHKTLTVHRIVAKTFIPNPEEKEDVNHIDGNKLNNNVNNLEWTTTQENIKKRYEIGIDGNNYKAVEQRSLDGKELYDIFKSSYEAEKITGIARQHIGACCRGERKSAGGYSWKFEIEEPKKIEKIKSNGDEFYCDYIDIWISKNKTDAYCEFLMNKINELIDEINNLKEK